MKHLVFALSCTILALAGCSMPDGNADTAEPERVERRPGYFDPK
jgi:hypothetical protein